MPKKLFLFLALWLNGEMTVGCMPVKNADKEASTVRILNGTPLGNHDPLLHSSVALFSPEGDIQHTAPFCTGVLIDSYWVLTVAHCATDTQIKVVFGLGSQNEIRMTAGRDIIRHPSYGTAYTEPYHFEVALLKLEEKAPPFAQPARLGTPPLARTGQVLTASGYGPTERDPPPLLPAPQALFKTTIKVSAVGAFDDLEEQGLIEFHPLRPSSSPCYGDSGGPLFAQGAEGPRLVGLVIGGDNCQGGRGFATNVPYWLPWIRKSQKG